MECSNESIGKILKIFRIANDLSVRDLAKQMEVTHSYISVLESGDRKITYKTLHTFAEAYKVGAYQIMDIARYYERLEYDEIQKYQLCLLKVLEIITSQYDKAENYADKSVLKILKIARDANQMTLKTASIISGVSAIYIAELENSKKDNISLTYLKKLANAYNLSVKQLYELADYYDKLEVNEERRTRLTLIKTLEAIDGNFNP